MYSMYVRCCHEAEAGRTVHPRDTHTRGGAGAFYLRIRLFVQSLHIECPSHALPQRVAGQVRVYRCLNDGIRREPSPIYSCRELHDHWFFGVLCSRCCFLAWFGVLLLSSLTVYVVKCRKRISSQFMKVHPTWHTLWYCFSGILLRRTPWTDNLYV